MFNTYESLMDQLHLLTAEKLIEIIKNGVNVLDKDGEVVNQPAPAAYIAAAIKFLKDNGVTSEPDSERMGRVKDAVSDLPTFDEDESEDRPFMN